MSKDLCINLEQTKFQSLHVTYTGVQIWYSLNEICRQRANKDAAAVQSAMPNQ